MRTIIIHNSETQATEVWNVGAGISMDIPTKTLSASGGGEGTISLTNSTQVSLAAQTVFPFVATSVIYVSVNGIVARPTFTPVSRNEYSFVSGNVTFGAGLDVGDVVLIMGVV